MRDTQDRRTFLAALGASLGTGVLAACTSKEGANAADSAAPAMAPAATASLSTIGVQLYTLRDEMKKDVEATLARVAKIGYKEVEFAGYFGRTPKQIRATLDANGLRAPSVHAPIEMVQKNWNEVVDAAKTIGHEYVIVPWLDVKNYKTVDDWKRTAEQLNTSGEQARTASLKLGYHNHDFEFVPVAGTLPFDVLLDGTDPNLVVMEMDLYWITKAGQSPLAYFDKYPGRTHLVHVKDSMGAPDHKMVAVGEGSIDFKSTFAKRDHAGIKHFFVEHDQPGDAFQSVETSFKNLSALRF